MICRICKRDLPDECFSKWGRGACKECNAKKHRDWRKRRGDKLEKETGHRTTEKERQRNNEYSVKSRLKAWLETGKTYRSDKEEARLKAYGKTHKKHMDELTEEQKEKRRRNSKRYGERKKMKGIVNDLDGIDFNDLF